MGRPFVFFSASIHRLNVFKHITGETVKRACETRWGGGRLDAVDAVVSVLDCISAALEQLHDSDQDTSNMHSDAV